MRVAPLALSENALDHTFPVPAAAAAGTSARASVLLVGGWKELYEKAVALRLDTTVMQIPSKMKVIQPGPLLRAVEIDTMDVEACVRLARQLHRDHRFTTVASFAELGLEAAAKIAADLGLPSNPCQPVALTRDKAAMRRRLAEAGFPDMRFRECSSRQDVEDFFHSVAGAIILKPSQGAGSKGVAKVERSEDIPAAWEWSTQADARILAEEFLDGPELSVESLSLGGAHQILAITEKITTGSPHFIELGHQLPARLDPQAAAAVETTVRDLLLAVGHQVGPAHTEVKLTPRGVRVIETQTRVGGDRIWEMVELATGCDMLSATLEYLVTGRRLPTAVSRRAAAVRFLVVEHCTVGRVEGVDEARRIPGVVGLDVTVKPGDVRAELTWSEARAGYALALGDTVEDAIERAERAMACVRIAQDRPQS